MKPVCQTRFKTETSKGNCQQAAVASILGVPLDTVPDFHTYQNFWQGFRTFLRLKGYAVLEVEHSVAIDLGCYYLAYGQTERESYHACVYRHGEVAHDPFPNGKGLLEVETVNILIPLEIKQ